MSIPMQVALPLALHLRNDVTFDPASNNHKLGGKQYGGLSIQSFQFINRRTGRFDATIKFASILRALYNHPDWSQIHSFCSKRYPKLEDLDSQSESRRIYPKPLRNSTTVDNRSVIANINTDPSTIGLPKDFIILLGEAAYTAIASTAGQDPIVYAIGPALSVAMGAGSYMDLIYAGKPPGTPRSGTSGSQTVSTSKKGGRGRTLEEWRELWRVIGDWVYENEAISVISFGQLHTYKYNLTDEEFRQTLGRKIPRKYLKTDAIHGADAICNVFNQLASDTTRFHGIEWDFLSLEVEEEREQAFLNRFGPRLTIRKEIIQDLIRPFEGLRSWGRMNYNEVDPMRLRPCPETFNGLDWERWVLSIEGGSIVVVETMFQALWAMMLLTYLPLSIQVVGKQDTYPRFPRSDCVYI